MKIIKSLLVFTYTGIIYWFSIAIPEYVVDDSRLAHAKNHVLQTLFWIIGYSIINIVVILIPFSRKEKWAWWLLIFSGLIFYAGYFGAIWITGGGAPGLRDDIFFGVMAGIYTVCILLSKKIFQ